jgi:hypothetical protein
MRRRLPTRLVIRLRHIGLEIANHRHLRRKSGYLRRHFDSSRRVNGCRSAGSLKSQQHRDAERREVPPGPVEHFAGRDVGSDDEDHNGP